MQLFLCCFQQSGCTVSIHIDLPDVTCKAVLCQSFHESLSLCGWSWHSHKLIKERDCVKKGVILKVISIVFVLITILAIACAITVTGSGFLDLSNIVKAVCIGVAVICGILAFITWKYSKSKA